MTRLSRLLCSTVVAGIASGLLCGHLTLLMGPHGFLLGISVGVTLGVIVNALLPGEETP